MVTDIPQPYNENDIDLRALLGTLLDYKWFIISVTVLFAIVSVIYAMLATPVYQANALVQVEQKVPDLPGVSEITKTLGTSSPVAVTEIALIQSRMVIGQVVKNLHLNIQVTPRRFPLIGGYIARHFSPSQANAVAPPLWGLNRYDWGGAKLELIRLEVPRNVLGEPLTLIAGSHGHYVLRNSDGQQLLQGVAGQEAQGHGVRIGVMALQANPGTEFAVTRSMEQATVAQLQQNIHASEQGKDSGIIRLTYDHADPAQANKVLDEVVRLYVRQNVERNAAQAASSLKFVKEQLPLVRRQADAAQAVLTKFQIKQHSVDVTMQTKALLDQAVALDSSIQELHLQQVQADRLFTKNHPTHQAIRRQLSHLEAKKTELDQQIGGLPDTQQTLLKLMRDVEVSNATYTNLLNQAQQLDIARAGTVGNVRIIDTAQVDMSQPVKPKKPVIALGGTFMGALLAIGCVYLRQALRRGLEDPADIEKLGLPVYASIPLSANEKEDTSRNKRRQEAKGAERHLLAMISPQDLAVEALRSLRTSLHFARLEAKNNLLMITGPSPGAGKTFVAGNLAAVIAQAGQRVLIIDADMRKGALHQMFGGRSEQGLSELISGQIGLRSAVRQVEGLSNLHFIARGEAPPNPSELLMHINFTRLLQYLEKRYDLVVIDTPPILAVTDAAIIGQLAGTSLLVARFGQNQLRELALVKSRFEQSGVELKGAIFNAVEKRHAGYYSYGYYEYAGPNPSNGEAMRKKASVV